VAIAQDRPLWTRISRAIVGAVLLIAPAVYLARQWFDGALDLDLVVREGGVLEMVHAALTLLATVLFFLSWRNGKGPVRVAGGALAMLAAAAFVREIDVRPIAAAFGVDWLTYIGTHGLPEILLVAMTLPIPIYLYRQRSQFPGVLRLALSWGAWPLYLAGALVLLCVYLDERVVHNIRMRFWEELIETYSYVFLAMAAWRHLQLTHDPTLNRDDA